VSEGLDFNRPPSTALGGHHYYPVDNSFFCLKHGELTKVSPGEAKKECSLPRVRHMEELELGLCNEV